MDRLTLQPQPFPILEFDPDPLAIIDPQKVVSPADVPERCVLCFFNEVLTGLASDGKLVKVDEFNWEVGPNPIYTLEHSGQSILVAHPGVGAAMAAGYLEELIALGGRKFIACGGAGVLDRDLAVGHLLVPTAAVRDEGTSYHYLPPGREVLAHPVAVAAIEKVLHEKGVDYLLTKAWTTDAPYRETIDKSVLRLSEGCLAVEMEAAAFFAVSQFRGVPFGQILYSGDSVHASGWDNRGWSSRKEIRQSLFWLAVEAVLEFGH